MISSTENGFDGRSTTDGEATLRLIAALPAPDGIEDRVKAGLKTGLRALPGQDSVIRWPRRSPDGARWTNLPSMRAAAAAAIVTMVVGGGWGVYTHIHVAPQPAASAVPVHIGGNSGLSAAGASRKPRTLEGPIVSHSAPVQQKWAASDAAVPHSRAVKKSKVASPAPR